MAGELVVCVCIILVLVSSVGVGEPVSAANLAEQPAGAFADVGVGFWAKTAIDRWTGYGVLLGDGVNFHPDRGMTRAEAAAVLGRIFGYARTADNPFVDVEPSDWFYGDVVKAYASGVMLGTADANGNRAAHPNDTLTRAEAAVLFGRAFSVPGNEGNETGFQDVQPDWAKESIYGMEACGYVGGYGGLYHPLRALTRAEAVQILHNMVHLYVCQPGDYTGDITGNVVVTVPEVGLRDMEIIGNLFLAEGIDDGVVRLQNVTVTGNTYIRGGWVITSDCDLGTIVSELEVTSWATQTESPSLPSPALPTDSGDPCCPPDPSGGEKPGGGEIIDL